MDSIMDTIINTIPDEILVDIFTYITGWYPMVFHVNKRFNVCMKEAVISNHRRAGDPLIRLNRHYALETCAKNHIRKYPNIIAWQYDMNYIYDYSRYCMLCLKHRRFILAKLLLGRIPFISKNFISRVVELGNIKIVKTAYKKYHGNTRGLCNIAAAFGNKPILQFLISRGCEYDQDTCRAIIQHRHFDLLKWWLNNGLPSYRKTHDAAKELNIISRHDTWTRPCKRQRYC